MTNFQQWFDERNKQIDRLNSIIATEIALARWEIGIINRFLSPTPIFKVKKDTLADKMIESLEKFGEQTVVELCKRLNSSTKAIYTVLDRRRDLFEKKEDKKVYLRM